MTRIVRASERERVQTKTHTHISSRNAMASLFGVCLNKIFVWFHIWRVEYACKTKKLHFKHETLWKLFCQNMQRFQLWITCVN